MNDDKRLTLDDLRASLERAEQEADNGELTDGEAFFAELDRLDAAIEESYLDCVIPDDELSEEDRNCYSAMVKPLLSVMSFSSCE